MHRKRRPSSIRNRGIIICIIVAVLLSVWTSVFALTGAWDPIRAVAVTVSSPITSLFGRAGASVARALDAMRADDKAFEAWSQEKNELEAKIAEQQKQLAELQKLQLENEQLRAYLSLTETHSSLTLLDAQPLYTADTTGRLVVLSRGSRDGVRVGMPVLDSAGLLGVVSEVSPAGCKVATLLDETVHIGVRNARSGVSGTLCGAQAGTYFCTLKYMDTNIDPESQLRVGDMIVTSGESEQFPAGLTVGRITEVGFDPYDRSPYAYVEIACTPKAPSPLLLIVTGETVEVTVPDDEPEQPPKDSEPDPTEPPEQQGDGTVDDGQDGPEDGQTVTDAEPPEDTADEQMPTTSGGFAGDEEVVS